ncbi:TATA box-binding protein-associated factor RNA polymerase I subunit A isoform X1 [Osmerus eperlanus]|uniref:TATA box-binding protein-associated factor RNA polymerase I subunit A isoform X1 n=1 Tax=Osmerus eperlanus TaxID=29151 RepID=UPI002E0E3D57
MTASQEGRLRLKIMDDLTTEVIVPEGEYESPEEEHVKKSQGKRSNFPLAPSVFKETPKESGFHKTIRTCLQKIREAMLHHRWLEASQFMSSYCQTLEDTTATMPQLQSEMIWRMGTEILHHNPNSKMEDYNSFYERMKNSGVKQYLVVCLEHAFHFLVKGQFEEAKRQLSIAESWRYGKQSAGQSQRIKLIQAYKGFLDYLIWCDKKATLSSTDDPDAGAIQEMHSYFRQSSVNLKEVMKTPGVWDPFLLSYVDMLEFYNDHDGALKVLNNYSYDNSFPPNPNAHVYLYQYLKKHDALPKKQIQVLKILHAMVPSHDLMLEYCSLLLQSGLFISPGKQSNFGKALGVCLDLLDYACWRNSLDVWSHVKNILLRLRTSEGWSEIVEELMVKRKDWWSALHFTHSSSSKENGELEEMKIFVAEVLCPSASMYSYQVKRQCRGASLRKTKRKRNDVTTRKRREHLKRKRELKQDMKRKTAQTINVLDQVFNTQE